MSWLRRLILCAGETTEDYGPATVLDPRYKDSSGDIHCLLIDRTHRIGCVFAAEAFGSTGSSWAGTLDGALVQPSACAIVINQQYQQFNLRITAFQMLRGSTGEPPDQIRCFVMDDPEVERAFARQAEMAGRAGPSFASALSAVSCLPCAPWSCWLAQEADPARERGWAVAAARRSQTLPSACPFPVLEALLRCPPLCDAGIAEGTGSKSSSPSSV